MNSVVQFNQICPESGQNCSHYRFAVCLAVLTIQPRFHTSKQHCDGYCLVTRLHCCYSNNFGVFENTLCLHLFSNSQSNCRMTFGILELSRGRAVNSLWGRDCKWVYDPFLMELFVAFQAKFSYLQRFSTFSHF